MGRHLTPKQAAAFRDRIRPMLNFVHRCRRRLEVLGFDQNNALYRAVDKTYCALHGLHVELHYESCKSGTYRPRGDQAEVTPPDPDQIQPGDRSV
jgi:hypothetical protein